MGDEARAYLLRPGEGRRIVDGPAPPWFKAGNTETAGAFNVHYNESDRFGGPGTPLHIHHRDDECVLQLEGECEIICGSLRFHLTPGCFAFLPRGVPHAVRNLTPTRSVAIVAPGTAWEYARLHMAAAAAQGMSIDDVFCSLPPEAQVEVIGLADWSDKVNDLSRPTEGGPA
jgi:mannose-6-phosphate isomerase-like protein (cupin superfamily)